VDNREKLYEIVKSFRQVNQVFHQALLRSAKQFGLTPIQLFVFKVLRDNPNIGLAQLADQIQLGNSTMSGVIDRMVRAGLVIRERSEEDRRSVTLKLTEEAHRVWDRTNEERLQKLEPLSALPENDLAELLRIHSSIAEILLQAREEDER